MHRDLSQAFGYALWMMGSVLFGSIIAQLFIQGHTKFGILVSIAAAFSVVGGAMKGDY
jgi:hypothetical protein